MNCRIGSNSHATANAARAFHETLLDQILPGERETALLRACLVDEPHRTAARDAWQHFVACVEAPKHYFESATGGIKGLLPFVEDCLRRNGIDVDAALLTYLRVAAVREELRDRIYRQVFFDALLTLQDVGLRPVVLRGLPLAIACYPSPSKRHNHGIDLLLETHEIPAAARALLDLGCRCAVDRQRDPTSTALIHSTGLPIVLHARLFELPHLTVGGAPIRYQTVEVDIDGRRVSTLSAHDQLLHVCGHACYSANRGNLRWVCDAVQLIRTHRDSIDWMQFASSAEHSRLALPMAVVLRYVGQLVSGIPEYVVARLALHDRLSDPLAREAIYAMYIETPSRSLPAWSGCPDIASWLRLGKFRVLPSRQYLAWKYAATGASIVLCYLARPLRFLARCAARVATAARRANPTTAEQAL